MVPRLSHVLTAMVLLVPAGASADPSLSRLLRQAVSLQLQPGINRLPNLIGDGRNALVVRAWRENGNAHGYNLYTVLMPTLDRSSGLNVVGMDQGDRFSDTISDAPHTGQDIVRAVRFVSIMLDRRRQTVLVTATRHWQDSIPNPAPTSIELFAVRQSHGDVGTTADYFTRIAWVQTRRRYCNAEMALKQETGLPLPPDYSGPTTKTGC